MRHRFLALGAALAMSLAAPPARASDAPDTVFLTNGQRVRGVVTQADPERGTTIVLPDGTVRRFRPSEVARVAFEDRGASARAPDRPDKPEKAEKPERAEKPPPKREEPRPVRYETPDDEGSRPVRKAGLRLGIQVQGGPFVATGLPKSGGAQFGFAARFGYQFDGTWALHWEPGVSFGLDSERTSVVVWNTALVDLQAGQFFFAAGPGLAAVWQFKTNSTQSANFGALLRAGYDVPSRGGSNVSLGIEARFAFVNNGPLFFPSVFIGYEIN